MAMAEGEGGSGRSLVSKPDTTRVAKELARVQQRRRELQVMEHYYTQTLPSMVGQTFEPLAGIVVQFHSCEVCLHNDEEIPGQEDFQNDYDVLAVFDFHEYLVGTRRRMVLTYRLLGRYIPYAVDPEVFSRAFESRLEAELNYAGYTLNADEPDGLRRVMNFMINKGSWLFSVLNARGGFLGKMLTARQFNERPTVMAEEREHGVFIYPVGPIVRVDANPLFNYDLEIGAKWFESKSVSLKTDKNIIEGRFVQVECVRSKYRSRDIEHWVLPGPNTESYHALLSLPEHVTLADLAKRHESFIAFEVRRATVESIHQGIYFIRDEAGTRSEQLPAVSPEDLKDWWVVRVTSVKLKRHWEGHGGDLSGDGSIRVALDIIDTCADRGEDEIGKLQKWGVTVEEELHEDPSAPTTQDQPSVSPTLKVRSAIRCGWMLTWALFLMLAPVGALYTFYVTVPDDGHPFFPWLWSHVVAITGFLYGARLMRVKLREERQLYDQLKTQVRRKEPDDPNQS